MNSEPPIHFERGQLGEWRNNRYGFEPFPPPSTPPETPQTGNNTSIENPPYRIFPSYNSQAVILLDRVGADYMHLTVEKFKRKRHDGEIDIPMGRLGVGTQKAALAIHIKDLADYIDRQREKAAKEQNKLMGWAA